MTDNFLRDKKVAIIAYGEVVNQRRSGKRPFEFAAEIMEQLLAKTGLSHGDIDGVATHIPTAEAGNTFYTNALVDNLGLVPRWLQLTDIGGCAPAGNIMRAAAAIITGQCEMVMCVNADSTGTTGVDHRALGGFRKEFMDAAGFQGPPVAFGILSSVYDQKYGLKLEALGQLAVTQRNGAINNENALAQFRKPITVEDYLASRVIAEPVRLLDCVMRCDGGNGFLVTSTERARAMGMEKLAFPVAYSEISNFGGTESLPDITETGFATIGPEVLDKAGMTIADIDMFQPYDDFLIAVMLQLEQIGFCKRGEGGDFILGTDLSPGGALPLNTGGGQISAGQPGLGGGGLNLCEAVRQLYGEAGTRQVANARNALVTGIGTIPYFRNWGSSACLILEN
ncbi:MAG: thiolase family protein [Alphaproteobacteria bacterium]